MNLMGLDVSSRLFRALDPRDASFKKDRDADIGRRIRKIQRKLAAQPAVAANICAGVKHAFDHSAFEDGIGPLPRSGVVDM